MAEDKKKVQVKLRQIKTSEVKNDAVKDAIAKVKEEKTSQNESKMLDAIRKGHFLIPVQFIGDPKNMQIKFILVNTNDGKTYFPAFTDEEEAKKLKTPEGEQRQYIVRSMREMSLLFNDTKNQALGVVVNPMSGNIVLPKESVQGLAKIDAEISKKQKELQEKKKNAVQAPVQLKFSEPRVYPTALVNAVYEACQNMPSVSRVWFKQVMAGDVLNFALIVEADDMNETLLNQVRESAVPEAKDVPVMAFAYNEEIEKKAVQGAVALYDRELDL